MPNRVLENIFMVDNVKLYYCFQVSGLSQRACPFHPAAGKSHANVQSPLNVNGLSNIIVLVIR